MSADWEKDEDFARYCNKGGPGHYQYDQADARARLDAIRAVIAHARKISSSDRLMVYAADIERALGDDNAPRPHKTSGGVHG